eukprot:2829968-Rhodomonas_salina.1
MPPATGNRQEDQGLELPDEEPKELYGGGDIQANRGPLEEKDWLHILVFSLHERESIRNVEATSWYEGMNAPASDLKCLRKCDNQKRDEEQGSDITKLLGEAWKSLSEEDRERYAEIAREKWREVLPRWLALM